jgi:acyl-CoA synthetase (AMP-forming)/AMP-acid ligase II
VLTIGQAIKHNARCHAQREAIICSGRRLTHAQFAERGRELGSALHRMGLRRQDRVAVLMRTFWRPAPSMAPDARAA